MFKIYDGREHFYQWDVDRQLIVSDPAIKEVHFCNRTDSCSLVCETYVVKGVTLVDVPNLLLQTAWRIRAYAYDGNYTKHEECYEVTPRTKPSDYVYTETEVKNYRDLEERINQIEEKGISDEKINSAVSEYLDANPLEFPVDSVNGKTGAVEITAADIGAMSADVQIPSTVGLATEAYVDEKVKNVTVDLTGYATEKYVDDAVKNVTVDTTGLATEKYVEEYVDEQGFATTSYVKRHVADEIESALEDFEPTGGGDVDLSNYYTKKETDTAINNAKPDLSGYALKTEIPEVPDVSEFMTEEDVEDMVSRELKGYASKNSVNSAISEALEVYYTKEEVDGLFAAIVDGEEVAY